MNPYRTRAIARDPRPRHTLSSVLRRLDYVFTERPAKWMTAAAVWFVFWACWGLWR